MATIVLRNGWNEPQNYNATSVTFLDPNGNEVTFYENGTGGGGTGGVGVQADWAQINPYHPSYIKNRPFYVYYNVIVEPNAKNFEVDTHNLYVAELQLEEPIIEGQDYIVYWKENGYLCKAKLIEGDLILGDASLIKEVEQEEDPEPFVGYFVNGVNKLIIGTPEQTSLELVGLFSSEEKVRVIDKKFLPDDIVGLDKEALAKYLADNKYVTESALDSYVTTAKLETTLGSYITSESLNATLTEKLKNYVTTSSLSNTLKSYYTGTQVDDKINTASTNIINQIDKELESYATLAKVNELLANLVDKNYVENRLTTRLKETQADWSIEDTTKLASIKNKPFGNIPDIIAITDDLEPAVFEAIEGGWQTNLGVTLDETKEYVVFWGEEEVLCQIGVTNEYFVLSADGIIFTTIQPEDGLKIGLRYADNVYRMQKKYLPVEELREDILEGMASQKYVDDKVAAVPQANWTEENKESQAFIKNKPTIPPAPVQSDWLATSGLAYIKNKPTIPAAQIQSDWLQTDDTKKDFIKNKPTIPDAQVQSNWTQSDSSKIDFIRNKPSFYANWNAKEGTSRIVDMPEVFRHSTEAEGMEEILLDTPEGWVKKEVTKLTMTVTFDDDTVKVYSMVGTEVTS